MSFKRFVLSLLGVLCLSNSSIAQEPLLERYRRWHSPTTDFQHIRPWVAEGEIGTNQDWNILFTNIRFVREVGSIYGTRFMLGPRFSSFRRHHSDILTWGKEKLQIDREDYTLELQFEARSTPSAYNEVLQYRLGVGVGGAYQHWNGFRMLLVSSIQGELSYEVIDSVGPFVAFQGRWGIAEDGDHLSARGQIGIRYASSIPNNPVPEARFYFLTSWIHDESNGLWDIERNSLRFGGGLMVRFFYFQVRAEAGVITKRWGSQITPNAVSTKQKEDSAGFAQFSIGFQF